MSAKPQPYCRLRVDPFCRDLHVSVFRVGAAPI
jgi:hypothetical protein